MKKVKPIYFMSFVTCVVYGAILDGWRTFVPVFNPEITPPGSMGMPLRVIFLILGMLLTAFSVAILFRTYIYPQVYDFFVKAVSQVRNVDRTKLKRVFDFACFSLAIIMTLVFFGRLVGVGWGTVVMTIFNGVLIGKAGDIIDRHCEIKALFPMLEEKFEL